MNKGAGLTESFHKWHLVQTHVPSAEESFGAGYTAGLAARAEWVPREPTPEMVDAGFRTFKGAGWLNIDAIHLWHSMYDAAPAPAPDAIQAAFDRGYTAAMNDVQAYSKPAPEQMASGIVIPPNGPESTTYTRQSAPAPTDQRPEVATDSPSRTVLANEEQEKL